MLLRKRWLICQGEENMNIRTEMVITLIFGILCDIAMAYMFYTIGPFPIWGKVLIFSLFNVAIGMVILSYLIRLDGTEVKSK